MTVCKMHAQSHTLPTAFLLLFGTVDAREWDTGSGTRLAFCWVVVAPGRHGGFFFCTFPGEGWLLGYLWLWDGSLHFAGLALRSLDPSSDCLADDIPLGVCVIIVGM